MLRYIRGRTLVEAPIFLASNKTGALVTCRLQEVGSGLRLSSTSGDLVSWSSFMKDHRTEGLSGHCWKGQYRMKHSMGLELPVDLWVCLFEVNTALLH